MEKNRTSRQQGKKDEMEGKNKHRWQEWEEKNFPRMRQKQKTKIKESPVSKGST